MERGLLFAFQVDYSHRDSLTLKLSREYSHYTHECNERPSDKSETNIERHQIQTLTSSLCDGSSRCLPGYS